MGRTPVVFVAASALVMAALEGAGTAGAARPPDRQATASPRVTPSQQYGALPISFEPNRGQANRTVQFLARGDGFTTFLTSTEAVFALQPPLPVKRGVAGIAASDTPSTRLIHLRYGMHGSQPQVVASHQLPGTVNYLKGADPRAWHTDIPTYAQVTYRGVYPGVDLRYYGTRHALEYDWIVRPGANPATISVRVDRKPALNARGDLVLDAEGGVVLQSKPVVYQGTGRLRHLIAGGYRVDHSGAIRFKIGRYDRHRPLVIDPTLRYSVDLGGHSGSNGLAIAVDSTGSAYLTGSTTSSNFPIAHAVQSRGRGDDDVFMAKLNSAGTTLEYSTYIGGNRADEGLALAVDRNGAAYITGDTLSDNYPTVRGALQASNASTCMAGIEHVPCDDAFITKLRPAGDGLEYSTYLGGNNDDNGYGIALDRKGNAYVTGTTESDNFPTVKAVQPSRRTQRCQTEEQIVAPCPDAFVAKLDPAGTHLIYSTYLGGSHEDDGLGIAVDRGGDAYVTGFTDSRDFPTVRAIPGMRTARPEISDAFVAELNAAGTALVYSTPLGGRARDVAVNITVRRKSAYITGFTWSPNFPLLRPLRAGAQGLEAFVSQIAPGGDRLLFSTFLGGNGDDEAFGIVTDASANMYVVGDTSSTTFPAVNAVQSKNAGQNDAFFTEIDSSGARVIQSTYFGGSNLDYGHGIALDRAGDVYLAGFTYSRNFPTAHGLVGAAGQGAFAVKLDERIRPAARPARRPA